MRNNLGGEANESDGIGGEPDVGPAAVGIVVGIMDFYLKNSKKPQSGQLSYLQRLLG